MDIYLVDEGLQMDQDHDDFREQEDVEDMELDEIDRTRWEKKGGLCVVL